jgi:hypothetical protein
MLKVLTPPGASVTIAGIVETADSSSPARSTFDRMFQVAEGRRAPRLLVLDGDALLPGRGASDLLPIEVAVAEVGGRSLSRERAHAHERQDGDHQADPPKSFRCHP